MKFATTDKLREMLTAGGEEALALLPAFEVPEELWKKHLEEVWAQGLHSTEEENHARALYRCLTSRVAGSPLDGALPGGSAVHVERAIRNLNQVVAAVAGNAEGHARVVAQARDQIVHIQAKDIEDAQHAICETVQRESGAIAERVATLQDQMEEQFRIQGDHVGELVALHCATQALVERVTLQLRLRIVVGFALVLALLLALMAIQGHAQAGQPDSAARPPAAAAKTQPKPDVSGPMVSVSAVTDLTVPDSYKLRIRNVQYEQDKVLIRLQNLQLQEMKALEEVQAKDRSIQEIVYELAVDKHVDVTKWALDLISLSWKAKGK